MQRKTLLMLDKEREHGEKLETLIRRLIEAGHSREQIAHHLGISYWTLIDWLRADRLGASFVTTVQFASEEMAGAR